MGLRVDLSGSYAGITKHVQRNKAGTGALQEGYEGNSTMTNCAAMQTALFTPGASEDLPGKGPTTQSQLHDANTQGHF